MWKLESVATPTSRREFRFGANDQILCWGWVGRELSRNVRNHARRFQKTLFAEPRVFAAELEQVFMRSALDDPSTLEDNNLIGMHDRGKPVCDHDRSAMKH